MKYSPQDEYEGYHRQHPDYKVTTPAFSSRGATIKIRKLLANMRLVEPKADLKDFVVVRK